MTATARYVGRSMSTHPLNVLFVCSANVCRSPLAAGLMAYSAKQLGVAVNVASASIDSEIRGTHPTTVEMLAARGVTLGRDHSQPIDDRLVNGAHLVLVMTSEHAKSVVGRFPKARRKVFTLDHLANKVQPVDDGQSATEWLKGLYRIPRDYANESQWDIEDPNQQSPAIYRAVEVQIDNATTWLCTVLSTLPA